jgi:hypothetical protein
MNQLFNDELQQAGASFFRMKTTEGYVGIIFSLVCLAIFVGGLGYLFFGPVSEMMRLFGF